MNLRLVFWNCGVAPPRARQGAATTTVHAAASVVHAALKTGADAVALCEVDGNTVDQIEEELGKGFRAVSMTKPVGRSRWDLAIFYRSQRLRHRQPVPVYGRDQGSHIRAAQRMELTDRSTNTNVMLYLLHWRSRPAQRSHDHREKAAQLLKERVRKDLRENRRVVVMGDFNDEPFDRSVSKTLSTSRDPHRVMRHPDSMLYNPTWWLAAPSPTEPWEPFGTHRYSYGATSNCYALDQALTSAHYLDQRTRAAPLARTLHFSSLGLPTPGTLDHLPLELTLP